MSSANVICGDAYVLADAVELDEVLEDSRAEQLAVKLARYLSVRILYGPQQRRHTSATPLTLREPMTAKLAMRTF